MSDNDEDIDAFADDIDAFADDSDVFAVDARSAEQNTNEKLLFQSMALSVSDAADFLLWKDASIVAIVGESNGGKTTLITELYGRFLKGSFAEFNFCHSLSLLGFEKKSFQSRAVSERSLPDTPRTSAQDGLSFFHLAVASGTDFKRHDLLISERAGEDYKRVRDTPALASDMLELRNASSIALIIDGERVADPRQRHQGFAPVRNIIDTIIGNDKILPLTRVQLVTTKFDLLNIQGLEKAVVALAKFEKTMTEKLASKFEVTVIRTSARGAPNLDMDPASGLDELLNSWVQPRPKEPTDKIPMPELTNEFDRLLLKRARA